MLYGRPFVYVNDLFLDPEAQTLWSYTMAIGQFQQDIPLWGVNQDPKDSKESPLYAPGIQVLIKVWKDGSTKAELHFTWKKTEEDTQYTCEPLGDLRYLFRLRMSAIPMNASKIKFLGIRFLRIALKSQHSLTEIVLQNRQEIYLLIPEQGGT